MLKRKIISLILIIFLSVILTKALAENASSPLSMLREVTNQMTSALTQNHQAIRRNTAVLDSLVEQILVPHVDLNRMSGFILGRYYWQSATPAQRMAFKRQFTRYVVRDYAAAFKEYTNQKFEFQPLRREPTTSDRPVLHSKIISPNGRTVSVTYNLIYTSHGWKVYDIVVEGVSMLKNYRDQFQGVLSQRGLGGLLQALQARNDKTERG